MEIRKAAIVGVGALGTMYGCLIGRNVSWDAVTMVTDPVRAARYRKEGVLANGEHCPFRYFDGLEPAEAADLVIFSVKAGGLEAAAEEAAPLIDDHTVILSVMNGISSEEILAERFGAANVLLCTAQGMDATRLGNDTEFEKTGNIWFGPRQAGQEEITAALADFCRRAGIVFEVAHDMPLRMWKKLMLNVGINQAATVFETNYEGMKGQGPARDVMLAAMREVLAVGNVMGIPLTEEDIRKWMVVTDNFGGEGMPSMRQDMLAGRKTELELFAGTIRRYGREAGVPTPVNDLLYLLIQRMEAANELSHDRAV